MCLEFLCCWCHPDEDGPDHHGTQSQHTGLSAGPGRPSNPLSERSSNGTDTWNGGAYPARHDRPSKPRSEQSSNGTDTWNGDAYPARHDPPSKPRLEPSSKDTDTWNGDAYPASHDPPSKPRLEPSSNGTDTWNGDAYQARYDPPSKPSLEPYNRSKNQVASGVTANRDTKAVHPRPNALAPQIANHTVLAAPVHQPNLVHTNGRRNGNMRKDEEEEDGDEDEEEEEEVPKVAQMKNRRFS